MCIYTGCRACMHCMFTKAGHACRRTYWYDHRLRRGLALGPCIAIGVGSPAGRGHAAQAVHRLELISSRTVGVLALVPRMPRGALQRCLLHASSMLCMRQPSMPAGRTTAYSCRRVKIPVPSAARRSCLHSMRGCRQDACMPRSGMTRIRPCSSDWLLCRGSWSARQSLCIPSIPCTFARAVHAGASLAGQRSAHQLGGVMLPTCICCCLDQAGESAHVHPLQAPCCQTSW